MEIKDHPSPDRDCKRFDRAVPRRAGSSNLVQAYDGPQESSTAREGTASGARTPGGTTARAGAAGPGGGTARAGPGGGTARAAGGTTARPGAGSARLERQNSASGGRGPPVKPKAAWG
ncbi:hypothetical protein T484DRAFT_1898213 [Baffinella frigidus]|nr:hypothetical protein T484DRAFT_1898213 [Cryptophyta sp. CCMP2293]